MKNKRLIVLLVVLFVFVTIAILCSTLFTVHTVTFSWKTEKNYLADYSDEQIGSSIKKGSSVFLLDKASLASEIESKYAYVKILKIETKFPNKIIVHAQERVSLYALRLEGDKYAILDVDCKVLDVLTSEEFDLWDTAISAKPIVVGVTNNGVEYLISEEHFTVGKFANVKRVTNLLSNLGTTLFGYYDKDYEIKGRIYNITINIAYKSSAVLQLTQEGMIMRIEDCYTNLKAKFAYGRGIFEVKYPDVTTGTIVVKGTQVGEYYYES